MPPTRMTCVDLAGAEAGVLEGVVDGADDALDEVVRELSNLARVSVRSRCLGPFSSAVMKGRLMFVLVVVESSILAFSAAS